MSDYRPRIGITMRLELDTDRFYLSRHYSEAIEAAGGAPVHISLIPDAAYISSVIESMDGILLPGSDSDVDPIRYGHEPHQALGNVHHIKDETDLLVLGEIEKRRLPVLGICFGMQVLNVARGGTLIQDITAQLEGAIKHQQGSPRERPSHRVKLAEGSLLATLAEADAALVNSHHHQAIATLGNNLVATAWTADGVVEALEDPRSDRFVSAVQWHPEMGWKEDKLSQALFEHFVSEAARHALDRQTSETFDQCSP